MFRCRAAVCSAGMLLAALALLVAGTPARLFSAPASAPPAPTLSTWSPPVSAAPFQPIHVAPVAWPQQEQSTPLVQSVLQSPVLLFASLAGFVGAVASGAFARRPLAALAVEPGVRPENREKAFAVVDNAPEKKLYRATKAQIELIESLDGWAEEEMIPILKGVEDSWQPQDFLPDPSQEDWLENVAAIKEMNKDMPDEVMISLVGDMVTEEALPTYQTMLNTMEGIEDLTGSDTTAWARWTRAWTAEENRHGDLLNKYLWMTGRVNMRSVEKTIQHLIGEGMDPGLDKNPYLGYIYTSFQERATKISHNNTGILAKQAGDATLGKICNLIAADEGRHEVAYQKVIDKLFDEDPEGTIAAYEDMMKKNIVMPAHLMYDGENDNLWDEFSGIAEKLGVYTAEDYATIIEHLNRRWNLGERAFTSGEGAQAQEYLMGLPNRIRRLAAAADKRKAKQAKKGPKTAKISWVYNRPVQY